MTKCSVCGKKVEATFLNKIIGTYIFSKGKKYAVCFECQKRLKDKETILKNIK